LKLWLISVCHSLMGPLTTKFKSLDYNWSLYKSTKKSWPLRWQSKFSWRLMCNQKEWVKDHTVHWLPARPQASMFSSSSSHSSDLCSSTAHQLPTDSSEHALQDQRCTSVLLLHNNRADFTSSIPCLAHSHKCQPRKLFHHKLYTLPESTSLISIKMFTKHQIPSAV
jgi:hypothetical protein